MTDFDGARGIKTNDERRKNMKLSLVEKFTKELAEIKDPVVFVGVAQVLQVSLIGSDKEPKDFQNVFIECIKAFNEAGRKRQKELLTILKDANKCKESINADSTKTSTEKESN